MNTRNFISLVLTLVFFLFTDSFSQQGWLSLPQNATNYDLNEVKFLNEMSGWACGELGTVIKTTNGGMNWSLINTGSSAYMNSVQFVNDMTGWIAADVNNFKKTTNGGASWINQLVPGTGLLDRCLALSDQICFASGKNGNLYRTTNGGASWTVVHSSTADYNRIFFINNLTGWVTATNAFFKTTDGGTTWQQSAMTGSNKGVHFVNELTGWVCSYPNVQKTTNGGATWQTYLVSNYGNVFYEVVFTNELTGYIAGSANNYYDGRIFKTTNGGVNWSMQNFTTSNGLYALQMINQGTGYAVGDGGVAFKTTNAGEVNSGWIYSQIQSVNNDLNSVKFINQFTGWSSGGNGTLIKSTDGGISWLPLASGTTSFITSVNFYNPSTGWFTSTGGVKKSTDGGSSWVSLAGAGSSTYNSIYCLTDQICFISALDGRLLRTTDGGTSWQVVVTSPAELSRFCFVNNLTGWASGINYIYRTTNGGTNWTQTILPGQNRDVNFINENTGWVPNFPNVNKTTDGGISWATYNVTSNSGESFYGIKFVNLLTGYCIGVSFTSGKIYKTTNGGVNWAAETIPSVAGIYNLQFLNELTGWAVGSRGNTFRTTTGGAVFISQTSSIVPENFKLSQNYPNPFNPSTRINYELKNTNYVTLKVFDLLGKEVASLVNEKQNAGSYAVDFNSTEYNLPSGIYFYTLAAGEFKETRKMILIK
ncbi:MAG: T9SS type A sorting domain-containing protein [Bacteroidetes bacterium]|nr:T9SS type A sorting domain-containing protein [Bacteroidota bacterium]